MLVSDDDDDYYFLNNCFGFLTIAFNLAGKETWDGPEKKSKPPTPVKADLIVL